MFQADGRIFEFSLDSDDGTLEGATKDIWNVCEIDGLTGNVVAVSKSRRILAVEILIFFWEKYAIIYVASPIYVVIAQFLTTWTA